MDRLPPRVPRDYGPEPEHIEWWKLLAPVGLIVLSIAVIVAY